MNKTNEFYSSTKVEREARIREILKGIDKDQVESDDGYWETSSGKEYGEKVLATLLQYINGEELGK